MNELLEKVEEAGIAEIGLVAIEIAKNFDEDGEETVEGAQEAQEALLKKIGFMTDSWQDAIDELNRIGEEEDYSSEEEYFNKVLGLMFAGIEAALEEGDQEGVEAWILGVFDLEMDFAIDNGELRTFYPMDLLEQFYKIDFEDEDLQNEDGIDYRAVAEQLFQSLA